MFTRITEYVTELSGRCCEFLNRIAAFSFPLEFERMKKFIGRYLPEELIRALQAAYWSIRLIRILQQV